MVILTIGAAHGLGIHLYLLTSAGIQGAILFGWISQVLALVAIGLGKVTIVAFILRIEGLHTMVRTTFLLFIAGSNLIVNCIAALLAMLQCSPIEKLWNGNIVGDCSMRERAQIFGFIQGCKFSRNTVCVAIIDN